ncbi:MAG TPA: hypothetical protein VKV17_11265 [Bryobacteraceae bacterium]|nr:hypothetical protein [Bryobacteraceae bacterium]
MPEHTAPPAVWDEINQDLNAYEDTLYKALVAHGRAYDTQESVDPEAASREFTEDRAAALKAWEKRRRAQAKPEAEPEHPAAEPQPAQPKRAPGDTTRARWKAAGQKAAAKRRENLAKKAAQAAQPEAAAIPGETPAETHLRTAKVKSTDPLGGGFSETLKVNFDDGTLGVFKPWNGERGIQARWNITPGMQAEREVGAWQVAKLVGVDDMATPCVMSYIGGRRGALMAWNDATVAFKVAGEINGYEKSFDGEENLARAAAFDYVIGNEDRHSGNWMLPPGRHSLRLIVHGLCFPESSPPSNAFINDAFIYRMVEISSRVNKRPKDLAQPYIAAKESILKTLRDLKLPASAVAGVSSRIDKLSRASSWEDLR